MKKSILHKQSGLFCYPKSSFKKFFKEHYEKIAGDEDSIVENETKAVLHGILTIEYEEFGRQQSASKKFSRNSLKNSWKQAMI